MVVSLNGSADAVTTEELTGDDVTGQTDTSEDKGAVVFYAYTFNVSTLSQAPNGVDLCCFFCAHGDGKNGIDAVATAEVFRLRYSKQRSIPGFFAAMSSGQ